MSHDDEFDDPLVVVAESPANDFTARFLRWAGLIAGIGIAFYAIAAA